MRIIEVNNEIAYECKYHKNYFITKNGDLYSIYIKGAHGKTDIEKPHMVAASADKDGYLRVVMSNNGAKTYKKIHTLVAEQFIGDITDGMVINHIDGCKKHNNAENLEIVSIRQNTVHAHRSGLVNRDIQVIVEYDDHIYSFYCLTDCVAHFPDLSIHYLNQLRNHVVMFSIIEFGRVDNRRYSKIWSKYNGRPYIEFASMKNADEYFGMKRGSTSSAIKTKDGYRNKINKYHITFPNVSTIESTSNDGNE